MRLAATAERPRPYLRLVETRTIGEQIAVAVARQMKAQRHELDERPPLRRVTITVEIDDSANVGDLTTVLVRHGQ